VPDPENVFQIKEFLKKNIEISLSLKEDNQAVRTQRKLQHIFTKRFSNKKSQKLFEIVLDHAEKAERACPQSGHELLRKFCGLEGKYQFTNPSKKLEVVDLIKNLNVSALSTSILTELLNHCNAGTKIKLNKSSNQKTYVEISNSYQFSAVQLSTPKKTQETDCKIFVIDGFIEDVSELHHLFYHFSNNEKETPFVIFCRGASDDVVSTISVNNARSSFKCYAYKISFDAENVNTLVDIAVVSGCDVTSSLKGELISSIKVENVKHVDSFTQSGGRVLIKCDASKSRVRSHLNNLNKKLADCNEIEKEYILKRISNLSANRIDVFIPDDMNYYARSQELDEGIRLILSIMNKSFLVDDAVNLYFSSLEKSIRSISSVI